MSSLIIYPGAFDPFHRGHLEVINQASKQLDATGQLWVCVEPDPRGKQGVKELDVRRSIISSSLGLSDEVAEGGLSLNPSSNILLGQLETSTDGWFTLKVSFYPLLTKFDEIGIILGADKYKNVARSWKGLDKARLHGLKFWVATRGGNQIKLLDKSDKVIVVESSISSKNIKTALKDAKSIKNMVSPQAQAQIEDFYP